MGFRNAFGKFFRWPWYAERAVAGCISFSDCMELESLEEVAWNSVLAFQDADDTARLLTAWRKFGSWAAPILPLCRMMLALRPGRGRLRSLARASVGFSWALCPPGVGVLARLCWGGFCSVQTTFKISSDPFLRPSARCRACRGGNQKLWYPPLSPALPLLPSSPSLLLLLPLRPLLISRVAGCCDDGAWCTTGDM